MEDNIYNDIAEKFGGNVYIGVVGPVRTGKSTFIAKMMENFVLPNIKNKHDYNRAVDEIPQAGDGTMVMTTQPKFVPNDGGKVDLGGAELNIRMVDSVGFMIDGVEGQRMVKTPWGKDEMPFNEAAKLGTKKVICEHSTFSVCMTTDGSTCDISRENYIAAEEEVIKDLKENNIPFIILLNSKDPSSSKAKKLREEMEEKYGVKVLLTDARKINEEEVAKIMKYVLREFPINKIEVELPKFMTALPFESKYIQDVIAEFEKVSAGEKIGEFSIAEPMFTGSEYYEELTENKVLISEGNVRYVINPKPTLFYTILSEEVGQDITDDFQLITQLKDLGYAKKEYDKLKNALDSVEENGYGVVYPSAEDLELHQPEMVKKNGKVGIKLKAHAPSLHIMKVDIETEINPIVGAERDSEEMVATMLEEFQGDKSSIWNANIFGKSVGTLVKDGVDGKIVSMPVEARNKMRKTLGRIVNEGKGGIICILL